ncbi:hypothetical protein LINPERHAP2_LOCUS27725 [Linum perenne]
MPRRSNGKSITI